MPVEKSIRGSARGATSSVANQFTSATASWLVASSTGSHVDRETPAARVARGWHQNRAGQDRDQHDRAEIREQRALAPACRGRLQIRDDGIAQPARARAVLDRSGSSLRVRAAHLDVIRARTDRRLAAPAGARLRRFDAPTVCSSSRCARLPVGNDCGLRNPSPAYAPAGSVRSTWSTSLTDSTKRRQSTDARKRRLPIELPIVTWSAAWFWLPA